MSSSKLSSNYIIMMQTFDSLSTEDKLCFLNDMQDILFKQELITKFKEIKRKRVDER